jgi:hypothetical protein
VELVNDQFWIAIQTGTKPATAASAATSPANAATR